VRIGGLDRLRRAYPINDLVEAAAARRAVRAALDDRRPRALVLSTITAAMLAPTLDLPYAVRLDSPARVNRRGLRNRPLHVLERRRLRAATLTLPWSEAARAALPADAAPAVVVPPPVLGSGPADAPRDRLAVAYVPDPKAKGLDVLCAAWARAGVRGARLAVFGIEPDRARRHLARTGIAEPGTVELRGMAPQTEFRSALRAATAFVGAARWEDFGQAPLEALADGALLATVPSGGAFEGLRLARELDPRLVADAVDPDALAEAIRAAFAIDEEGAADYRERGARLLAPYRPDAIVRVLRERVLPALLG
jgi:glycosyltransferase involved in cell wall biosynthesis